jgi:hypothetical protein
MKQGARTNPAGRLSLAETVQDRDKAKFPRLGQYFDIADRPLHGRRSCVFKRTPFQFHGRLRRDPANARERRRHRLRSRYQYISWLVLSLGRLESRRPWEREEQIRPRYLPAGFGGLVSFWGGGAVHRFRVDQFHVRRQCAHHHWRRLPPQLERQVAARLIEGWRPTLAAALDPDDEKSRRRS